VIVRIYHCVKAGSLSLISASSGRSGTVGAGARGGGGEGERDDGATCRLDAEDAIFDEAGVVADAESAGTAGGFFFFDFFSSFGVFVAFAGSAIEIFSDDPAATTFGGASD
jgi:hypothetical protein